MVREHSLSRLIAVGILVVACDEASQAKNKKPPEPPRQTYPKSRLINRSCQAVWAVAMPLMTEAGFTPQTSDREGGIASFTYGRGSSMNADASNDAKLFTTAPVGFWTGYTVFSIQSATLTVIPAPGACTCQMSFNFQGLQRSMAGQRWYMLESNGFMEHSILGRIQEKALGAEAAPATVKPEPVVKIEQPAPAKPAKPATNEPPTKAAVHVVCPEGVNQVPFSSSRPDRRTLACDEAVTILSESPNWIRVKTADGLEGNVAPKFLTK